MDEFAPFLKKCGSFVVRNITGDRRKTIKIFQYPILYQQTRDLLAIPGVAEGDIRASLLKGEIRHKFLSNDIELVHSDIDLLQFNICEKEQLISWGFNVGLDIGCSQVNESALECINEYVQEHIPVGNLTYTLKQKISLIGTRDGSNRTFFTPDKFINGLYFGNTFHITVEHNGKELYENIDFTISESSGPGTGYDTINLIAFTPVPHSLLYSSYSVKI